MKRAGSVTDSEEPRSTVMVRRRSIGNAPNVELVEGNFSANTLRVSALQQASVVHRIRQVAIADTVLSP